MFCWVLNKCLIPETSPILHWLDENLWGNLVEILQERSNQPHGWRRLWTFKVELYLLFNYGESQAIAVIFWVILSIASYFKSSRWNSGTWFYEGKRFFVRFYKYLFYCCSSVHQSFYQKIFLYYYGSHIILGVRLSGELR